MDSLTEEQNLLLKDEIKAHSREVYVKNLDFKVTEYELRYFCQNRFGAVEACKIKMHTTGKFKGKPRGHANILFSSLEAARKAQHNNCVLNGRRLNVQHLPLRDAELYVSNFPTSFGLCMALGNWETENSFVAFHELQGSLSCKFVKNKRKIELEYNHYKMNTSFKDLSESFQLQEKDGILTVYMSLKRPPRIYIDKSKFYGGYGDKFSRDVKCSMVCFKDNLSDYLRKLPFKIRFKVEALINSWKIMDPRVHANTHRFEEFIDALINDQDNPVLEAALDGMLNWEKATIFDPLELLNMLKLGAHSITVGEDFMAVGRVLISPTKIYLVGPEIEVSNRVLRHYNSRADRFLRASFVDENFRLLMGDQLSPQIENRISTVLNEGVKIAGRTYEFLAFSSSQLREHGCWLYAGDNEISPHDIRNWMGNFSGIEIVAKYAARMGQCFSTTFCTSTLTLRDVKTIPDIEVVTNGKTYTFSDGIGKISQAFAEEVTKKLGRVQVPSAFQIRCGGLKGVMAVDPNAHHKLYKRPSMNKFSSGHLDFEVIEVSHFIPSYLNRQIIVLLVHAGIPDQIFEDLQDEMVKRLNSMLNNDITAKEIIQSIPDQYDFSNTVLKMLRGGFSVNNEAFLFSLIKTMHAKKMQDLRLKTRILLEKSVCLMGTLDETKSLKYGQVFVQIKKNNKKPAQIILGKVFVVKNPAFHPGDIRVVECVDCPFLHHMENTIVFPAVGPRPHPNETSGGDLDGDIYTVCYDERLVPRFHFDAGDFSAPEVLRHVGGVTISDVIKFFIDYMKNDVLGIIANCHLAISDYSDNGPGNEKCLELTKLHSIAVDYPKTGVPAVIPRYLRVHPDTGYPDFMEKKGRQQYNSQQIIGKLYRKIKHHSNSKTVPVTFDPELQVEGHEEFLELADITKKEYNFRVITLMNQFGVKTEAELVSGCVIKFGHKYLKQKPYDHIQRMCQAIHALKKEFRTNFEQEFEGLERGEDKEQERKAKASAWYVVTYKEEHRRTERGERAKQLLSFAWVMVDVLSAIKKDLHL